MESASDQILHLKNLLREQFPEAHFDPAREEALEDHQRFRTGIPRLDDAEIARGTIVELSASQAESESALVIASLIELSSANREPIALIDGADSFDPLTAIGPDTSRLLWVRCREFSEALRATDLLLRDGNIPTVILDLQFIPPREVRQHAGSCWRRFRNLVEKNGATLLVTTPDQLVEGAHLRFELKRSFGLDALEESRMELRDRVQARLVRARTRLRQQPSESQHEETRLRIA